MNGIPLCVWALDDDDDDDGGGSGGDGGGSCDRHCGMCKNPYKKKTDIKNFVIVLYGSFIQADELRQAS